MPKEVIHDPTPIPVWVSMCQCENHAPYYPGQANVGGRAWVEHDVLCNETCDSVLTSAHPVRMMPSDRSEQSTRFAIEVTWGRDTHMQIATTDLYEPLGIPNDGRSKELHEILESVNQLVTMAKPEHPKSNDAKALQGKIEEAAWMLNSRASGLFVDLDRARTNKLIKTLKRARDQAFGADE